MTRGAGSRFDRDGLGIRYREHPDRKHGKRPDRYWSLKYKFQGRTVTEALGWGSQGFTQAKAQEILAVLRRNWRTGAGPRTWRELRAAGLAEEMAVAAGESVRRRPGEGACFQKFNSARAGAHTVQGPAQSEWISQTT